jgi:hypothetical protein
MSKLNNTVVCKHCQAEMKAIYAVCPVCGMRQDGKNTTELCQKCGTQYLKGGSCDCEGETRLFFGRPIRKDTTAQFFQDPLTIEEFKATIAGSFDAFAQNMKTIGHAGDKHVELWAEQYLAWLEIEQER